MITVNSSGNPISAGFITALTSDNRTYDAKLLLSGTELDCSITRLTITKGSCGSAEAFTIGNVVGSTLVAEVKGLSTAVKGQELEVRIGVSVNGSYEYITLGYFVVSEAPQTAYATTITAYGATITRTGDAFTPPSTQTLGNVASAISTSASALAGRTVNVTFASGITTSDTITVPMNGLTVYQALQVLASVVGGYAVDTYDGNIKICRFSDTATLSRDTSTMKNLPVVEEANFEINGVLCIVTPESEDEEGQVVPAVQFPTTPTGNENLVVQNQYMTQALYTSYLSTLAGYEYRPATIGLTYGDPRLEGNDVVQVTDINSNVYAVPCHLITHTYTGGFSSQIVSVTATPQNNDVATSAGNLTEQLSSIAQNTISARASAETAKAYAEEAKQTTDIIKEYAEEAGETVEQILDDALTAGTKAQEAIDSAEQASISAGNAYNSATQAINQLSVVEDIVGVLDLISQNGNYVKTTDTEVLPDKWYFERIGSAEPYTYQVANVQSFTFFLTSDVAIDPNKIYYTRSGSGTEEDPYVYTQVENPVVADIGTYYECTNQDYYELAGIDSAIQNYVSSHLVLAGNTLSLQHTYNGETTRLDMSTTSGVTMYDKAGNPIAQYGSKAVIGDPNKFHITIDPAYDFTLATPTGNENPKLKGWYELSGREYVPTEDTTVQSGKTYYAPNGRISFYNDSTNQVAYISGDRLYITQTVVLQQMDIGTKTTEGGLGQWSWKVHEVDGKNNLYLKWLG